MAEATQADILKSIDLVFTESARNVLSSFERIRLRRLRLRRTSRESGLPEKSGSLNFRARGLARRSLGEVGPVAQLVRAHA
jgi:hypothetical protein